MTLPPAGNNMIQVAIIGAGFIGPAHLEALRQLGDVEVVALCDSRLEAAQRKARALNIAHAYDSVEALLAHPGLQVVHNCTPNHLHAQINRQILAAGLHVFSEKPLCMTAGRRGSWWRLPPGPAWCMASASSIASSLWSSRRRR